MSKRRRYHTVVTCGACGRSVDAMVLSSHERGCLAWRRRETDGPEETAPAAAKFAEAISDRKNED